MGCLNTILKMCPDKHFVRSEKSAGDMGFIGSAVEIIFSTEPRRSLAVETLRSVCMLGGLWDGGCNW